MNSFLFFLSIIALAIGTFHYWRQGRGDTGLPPSHPRRRRAKILFPFMLSFGLLALIALCTGVGTIVLVGFGVWFVALFLVRKQIPKEPEIRAYETAHPFVYRFRQPAPPSQTQRQQVAATDDVTK